MTLPASAWPRVRRLRRYDPADPAALFWAGVPEAEVQEKQRLLCKALGLLYYHTYRPLKSVKGFPDTFIALPPDRYPRGPWICLWENKREGAGPDANQRVWLALLARIARAVGEAVGFPAIDVRVVTPSTYEAARRLLEGGGYAVQEETETGGEAAGDA